MSASFTGRDWEAWALEEGPDLPSAPAAPAPRAPARAAAEAAPGPRPSGRVLARLAVGSVAFGLLAALTALLPPALPGEMPADALTARDAPPCAACPPSERLSRFGAFADGGVLRANVLLDAAPGAGALRLEFDGIAGTLVATRGADGGWRVSTPAALSAGSVYVAERGSLVVLGLPAAASIRGAAVRTAGDRIPASGFLAPGPSPGRRPGLADAFVVAVLLAAAVLGWRRGLAAAAGSALALAAALLLTALVWRPVAALVASTARTGSASGALSVGLLAAAFGFASGLLTRPLASALSRLRSSSGPTRALAAAFEALRMLAAVAILLAVAAGLAAFGGLAPALRASALAGPLVDGVRHFFS